MSLHIRLQKLAMRTCFSERDFGLLSSSEEIVYKLVSETPTCMTRQRRIHSFDRFLLNIEEEGINIEFVGFSGLVALIQK